MRGQDTVVNIADRRSHTGLRSSFFSPELDAKRLELLKEAMPQLARVAMLLNPTTPSMPDL